MSEPHVPLLLDARRVLNRNQRELAQLLRVSKRTVQRWDSKRSAPASFHYTELAAHVYPHDVAVARRLAARAGTTLEALGLVMAPVAPPPAPAPPPAAPPGSATATRHMVDVVVCAASDALEAPPGIVRPVLLAAMRKALEVGVSRQELVDTLGTTARPATPASNPKGSGSRKGKAAPPS